MKVTEVRVSPSRGGKVRAFASIVIDDCFIVNDLRVIEGREGQVFVTMPARKARNGQMRDIAHPLNSATREIVEEAVLAEFERAVKDLALPSKGHDGPRKKEQQSMFDRIAARLFSEDYWTEDATPRRTDDD